MKPYSFGGEGVKDKGFGFTQLQHTCSYLTWRDPMIGQPTQGTEGKIAAGADAHGAARLLHHRQLAAWAGTVYNICHQVQGGLEEKAVITGK